MTNRRKPHISKYGSVRTNRKRLIRTANHDREALAKRIATVLSAEQLTVACWYYYDGLELQEIAAYLGGVSPQAINRRLDRIDKQLRKHRIPLPRRLEHPYATDTVGNYNLE